MPLDHRAYRATLFGPTPLLRQNRLLALAAHAPIPVYAMVRPRAGDFVYSTGELDTMLYEIDAMRAAGLAGVVLGASLADGQLDTPTLRRLCAHAQGLGKTLHRAFDLVPDLDEALATAIELQFERVLTSGRAASALLGMDDLRYTVQAAAGRIGIMPGAGLNAGNVAALVARQGDSRVHEVHGSCSVSVAANNPQAVEFGFSGPTRRHTNAESVREFKAAFCAARMRG